jgi:casein kinase 1
MNSKVNDNYKIYKLIGKGSFGSVYMTYDKDKNIYAAKVETKNNTEKLINEYKIYNILNKNNIIGLPKIYNLIQTPSFNIMIMEMLGPCLDKLFNKFKKKFSLSCVLLIGIDILNMIEQIHNMGFIHRDIKPQNFLINSNNNLVIIDFGLGKKYVRDSIHMKYCTNKNIVGTLRYASLNMHLGIEVSRRDDLESIGYMLIYFLKGILPWQGLTKKSGENQTEIIGNSKLCTSLDKLCFKLHSNFKKFIAYCRNLKFDETPNYDLLRNLLLDIAKENKIELVYDWTNNISVNIVNSAVNSDNSDIDYFDH